jgi:hypothetical protein
VSRRGKKAIARIRKEVAAARRRHLADARLKELILHIARQSEDDEAFGAVKLNKILFVADFDAYIKYGKSISGQEYFALEHGPAPRRLKPVLDEMIERREAAEREDDFHGYRQRRVFALREADLKQFEAEEIALVDHIIRDLRGVTGSQLSRASHRFLGWKVAAEREVIPYSAGLVCQRDLTKVEQEVARGLEVSLRA